MRAEGNGNEMTSKVRDHCSLCRDVCVDVIENMCALVNAATGIAACIDAAIVAAWHQHGLLY